MVMKSTGMVIGAFALGVFAMAGSASADTRIAGYHKAVGNGDAVVLKVRSLGRSRGFRSRAFKSRSFRSRGFRSKSFSTRSFRSRGFRSRGFRSRGFRR